MFAGIVKSLLIILSVCKQYLPTFTPYSSTMFTEQDHLQGKDPIVPLIYKKLIKEVNNFGLVKVEPKKASIQLMNRFSFAGIFVRKNCLNIEIQSNHKIKSKRFTKAEQVSANRYVHSLTIQSPAEVDEEFLAWMKEAYDLKV
jgi:hypothetical protein